MLTAEEINCQALLQELLDRIAELEGDVEKLWKLLDDIDTGTDAFKSCVDNENKFIKYVYRKIKERFAVRSSDGYKLLPPKP
jgi:hypothetical protein